MDLHNAISQMQKLNEQKASDALGVPPQPPTAEQIKIWREGFEAYCQRQAVRPFPISPVIVAGYIQGLPDEEINAALEALVAICEHFTQPNPCATRPVRAVLERRFRNTDECPKSWTREDRMAFVALPEDVKRIVLRREEERDLALRRAQNKLAQEIKRLSASADAEPKPEKETTNGNV